MGCWQVIAHPAFSQGKVQYFSLSGKGGATSLCDNPCPQVSGGKWHAINLPDSKP